MYLSDIIVSYILNLALHFPTTNKDRLLNTYNKYKYNKMDLLYIFLNTKKLL